MCHHLASLKDARNRVKAKTKLTAMHHLMQSICSMLVSACLRTELTGWTLVAVCFGRLVKLSEASFSARTKDLLLLLESNWSTADEMGSYTSSGWALGWHADSEPCLGVWRGIECTCTFVDASGCQEHEIIGLNLSAASIGQKLYGVLPDVFDQLPELQHLDLSDQLLYGSLPQTIFGHPSLLSVSLRNNYFSGPLHALQSQSSKLSTLDVRFNMLSGELDESLCDVGRLLLDGNSLLCGQLPRCLRYVTLNGAAGASLGRGSGLGRDCTMPVASCDAAPGPWTSGGGQIPALRGGSCKATIDKTSIGRVPINVSFSTMTDVDVLMVEFTDFGLHSYRAWFWAQDKMFQALMAPQVSVKTVIMLGQSDVCRAAHAGCLHAVPLCFAMCANVPTAVLRDNQLHVSIQYYCATC